MTGPAGRLFVRIAQWKIRLRMVEARFFPPTSGGMAFRALFAELAVVGVILLMAGNTA